MTFWLHLKNNEKAETREEQLLFDNIRVLRDAENVFLSVETPVDSVHILNSFLRNSRVVFHSSSALTEYGKTVLNMHGCRYCRNNFLENSIENKEIEFHGDANFTM